MLSIENDADKQGSIAAELTGIGAQCRGERHLQVIARQREAINDLRKLNKQLEENKTGSLAVNIEHMPSQIILLKKQLAEIRANQALTEDIARYANLTRGNEEGFLMIEEKTAHYETQTALEHSEESFIYTIRSLSKLLDLNELKPSKSMANLPPNEIQKLNIERSKSISIICSKINFLRDSLMRKEEILKDYEVDLAKLRQAEFLLQKKSDQLDEFQLLLRDKNDENEYLRESLKNTKLELDKERMLNSAIKQKKTINLSMDNAIKKSVDSLNNLVSPRIIKRQASERFNKSEYSDLKSLRKINLNSKSMPSN